MKKLLPMRLQSGFSLIELLVVAAIITTLLSIGVSALVTYSNAQVFNSKIAEMVTTLQTAKTYAQSQVKKCADADTFVGYSVSIDTTTTYSLKALCKTGSAVLVETKTLRNPITVEGATVVFNVLTGSSNGGNILMKGYNRCQTISINTVGNISVAQVIFSC